MVDTERPGLTDSEFRRVSDFVRTEYGINLTDAKKVLLESRLRKRLARTNIGTYGEYVEYLFTDLGRRQEHMHMIDAISTNKTDFFREPAHFEFLAKSVLPELSGDGYPRPGGRGEVRAWSAACSTGEEPFTIAMVMAEYAAGDSPFEFSILGTDISSRVLEHAARAIYDETRVAPVPPEMRRRYLRRGTNDFAGKVRIAPDLRSKVRFERTNLNDYESRFDRAFDFIFLRNVIIYFDKETKRRVVSHVADQLRVGGYLFVGHSETLFDMNLPLEMVQPTIYRRLP